MNLNFEKDKTNSLFSEKMKENNKKKEKEKKEYSCCLDPPNKNRCKIEIGKDFKNIIKTNIKIKNNGRKNLPSTFKIKNHPDNKIRFIEKDVTNKREIEPDDSFALELTMECTREITEGNYIVIVNIEIKNYEPFEGFVLFFDIKSSRVQNKTPQNSSQTNLSHNNNSQIKSSKQETNDHCIEKEPPPEEEREKDNKSEQLKKENEILKKENEILKKENNKLKKENNKLKIDYETLKIDYETLKKENDKLKIDKEKLEQVKRLLFQGNENQNEVNKNTQFPKTLSTFVIETRQIEISSYGSEIQTNGILKEKSPNIKYNNNNYIKITNLTDENQVTNCKEENYSEDVNAIKKDTNLFSFNTNTYNQTINGIVENNINGQSIENYL